MADDTVITDEMKAAIGVESEPSVYEIERSSIRRFAEAIGDTNPLYHDEEYAKSKGYRSLIAPPGFIAQYAFPIKRGKASGFKSPFSRNLNGGNEYEFFKPIQAGDTITSTNQVIELREKAGRMGTMLITVAETTYKDQDGDTVAIARSTGISY